MRRGTVTIPDSLEPSLERFMSAQPARPSLTSVLEAALTAYLDPTPEANGAPSRLPRVMQRRARIRELAHAHGAHRIALFGSTARGEDSQESDVDFWVEASGLMSLFDLAALRGDLASELDARVDVLTLGGLSTPEADSLLAESIVL